jgi:CheY-like chemotaxis protein
VLLVEDNADVVALFTRYLMPEGFQCIAVTDSTVAHEQILAHRPDAVILDVMMRKMDGWELLQRIKADPSLRSIPVVVCSVLDERELANSLGANAYLRKPIRPAELIECLLGLCH